LHPWLGLQNVTDKVDANKTSTTCHKDSLHVFS
jgi:hypothetical protein